MGLGSFIWYGGGFYLKIVLTAAGISPFAFAKVEAEIDIRSSIITEISTTNVAEGSGVILEQELLYIRGNVQSINPSVIQQSIETGDKTLVVTGTITQTITVEFTGSSFVPIPTIASVGIQKFSTADDSLIDSVVQTLTIDHRDTTAILGRVYTQSVSLTI